MSIEENNTNNFEAIKVLYQENNLSFRALTEWRLRAVSRYVITIAGLLFVEGWLLKTSNCTFSVYFPIPFYLISILTCFFYKVELRNARVMNEMIHVSYCLEEVLSNEHPGMFRVMNTTWKKSDAYILKYAYGIIGLFSLMLAVFHTANILS
jgi:hypothetical protein